MRLRWLGVAWALFGAIGCGGRSQPKDASPARFEVLDDTAGASKEQVLLGALEVSRGPDRAIQVRGRARFPDRTRLQLTIRRPGSSDVLGRVQFAVLGERFESPPILGAEGALPAGRYQIEVLTLFDPAWQPPEVMTATDGGRLLRGPGVTRGRHGVAAFVHAEERQL